MAEAGRVRCGVKTNGDSVTKIIQQTVGSNSKSSKAGTVNNVLSQERRKQNLDLSPSRRSSPLTTDERQHETTRLALKAMPNPR